MQVLVLGMRVTEIRMLVRMQATNVILQVIGLIMQVMMQGIRSVGAGMNCIMKLLKFVLIINHWKEYRKK